MTDSNPRQDGGNQGDRESWPGSENDRLDRELDATLAKYAAVDPRPGLEERVLANLRAEQERAVEHSWWRWPVLGIAAVVIVAAASLVSRSGKLAPNVATQHSSATIETHDPARTQLAKNGERGTIRPHEGGPGGLVNAHAASHPSTVVPPAPKLEQFPSPQPLSEQERILADYVADYPDHAALIAQARAEALRRDSAEEIREAAAGLDENSKRSNQ
jgi:hypothetical protein